MEGPPVNQWARMPTRWGISSAGVRIGGGVGTTTTVQRQQPRLQRQRPTSGGTVRSARPANCCQHIPPYSFLDGYPDPSQFAATKLTHYSSKPQRPSDSSRPRQRLLLSGDAHPNPGTTTKYLCPVCARNVTSRG